MTKVEFREWITDHKTIEFRESIEFMHQLLCSKIQEVRSFTEDKLPDLNRMAGVKAFLEEILDDDMLYSFVTTESEEGENGSD